MENEEQYQNAQEQEPMQEPEPEMAGQAGEPQQEPEYGPDEGAEGQSMDQAVENQPEPEEPDMPAQDETVEPVTQQGEEEPDPEQTPEQPQARTFTQEELDRIVGKVRAEAKTRAINEFVEKYGLDDASQLDEMFGNGERYSEMQRQQEGMNSEMDSLRAENALLRSGIDPDYFEDVKAIITYGGKEINPATIEEALATHPYWLGYDETEAEEQPEATVVRKLGAEPAQQAPEGETEEQKAMKLMFGGNR